MIKAVIFDFDGVLVESVDIKTKAFAKLFESEGADIVEKVVDYHLRNAGVSRFEKFRCIYKEILKKHLSENEFQNLCSRFSQLVADAVAEAPFVSGAREFLENYLRTYDFYIASATPLDELERIIEEKKISRYFKKIYGAPQKKADIVRTILSENDLKPQDVLCIGDAMSDYEAAKSNGVAFIVRITKDNVLLFKDINCLRTNDLRNLYDSIIRKAYLELDEKLKEAFDFLSSVNQKAYKNIYLLSNLILSKNPFANNFLNKFLEGEKARPQNIFTVISRLLVYYLKSFVYFVIYMLFFASFRLSGLRYSINPSLKEFILIDTFFLIDRIQKSNKFEDSYFIGLKEVLDKLGKDYAYLPVFYSTKNPLRLFKIFKILKRDKEPVLTEYQLLSGMDLLKIFYFILSYPFKVLMFAKNIKEDAYLSELLRSELVSSLRYASFLNFSRYLQGRKIAGLPYKKIKVISWFENQTIDKNLYKGLREGGGKVKIYGSQPFVYSKSLLNLLPDENESRFGIVPDKIVVNGSYYIPKDTTLNFTVGPSFRYKKIFTTEIDAAKQKGILVLMPYFVEDIENILKLLGKADLRSRFFMIKAHPSTPINRFRKLVPVNAEVTGGDVYELFKTAKITISSESGSMVESASLGIPVISIKNSRNLNHNPLPAYGKGIIWDEVENAEELDDMIAKFEDTLNNENKYIKIKAIAQEYKRMFFCEATVENIITTYGLDS
jgi:HAD superfamily hydrolase (TIGR01549 family)